ncbi:hypothetical protein BY458DRAFT_558315 [Sporodiniella umbellata]|nr:hypothetical protein BY458DRAFT_558315 [Sporodiniella umbellata]
MTSDSKKRFYDPIVFGKGSGENRSSTEDEYESLWSRIEDHFKGALGDSYIPRNDRSLPSRWQIINKAVGRYKSILSQVEKSRSPNSNSEDIESEAKRAYKFEMKSKFNLMHCYTILNRNMQWLEQQEKKRSNISKSKTKATEGVEENISPAIQSLQQEKGDKENGSILARSFSIGSNNTSVSSKWKKKSYIDMVIESRKEKRLREYNKTIEAKQKAALANEALAKAQIMAINPETVTDFPRRKWIENMQQKILNCHFDFY